MPISMLILFAAQAAAPAQSATPSDPNQLVCRFIKETNSLIPERTCRTRAEWAQMEKDAQADWRKAMDNVKPGGDCQVTKSC